MKVAYHLNPDDAPARMHERLKWLLNNGQRIADEMIATMRDNADGHAIAVSLYDVHVEIVPDPGIFGLPMQTARLVVTVEIDTTHGDAS